MQPRKLAAMLTPSMFRGFDPSSHDPVLPRLRGRATALALTSYLLAGGYGLWNHSGEAEIAVELAPEIQDFAVSEEPEPEPEVEEDLPPPPPEAPPPKPRAKPKPKARPIVPDKLPEGPPPEQDSAREDKSYGTGSGTGTGTSKPKASKPVAPKPKPKPKPEAKHKKVIDPEKPIKRPEGASVPKPNPQNKAPTYPSALQSEGIEGEVVLKLHVHRDGKVRGAKILRVTTTATGEEAQKKAKLLLKKAAIAAIKTWTYTPSKLGKQTISVWIIVNMPFRLRAG